jgi:hypothetical protein
MGETNASLLGSMLVVKIYLAAMSRADEPAVRMAKLPRFYFYVDEFQSMMNEAFADILSESRKYKLALTLANQYIEQMEEEVRDAVFGNVGTLIVFRVGPFDAEVLETVFDPTFTPEDLVALGIGQIYLTLMIDGVGSKPFSAETIPPIDTPAISYRDDCVRSSRELYGRVRAQVEAAVNQKQLDFQAPPREKKEPKSSYGTRPRASDAAPRPAALAPREIIQRTESVTRTFSTSTSPSVVRPDDQRSALRAALAQAKPAPLAPSAPAAVIRSPADVLRERRAQKSGAAANAAPKPVFARIVPDKPHPQPKPIQPPRPSAEREPQPAGRSEVSPEELQRVLRGEE